MKNYYRNLLLSLVIALTTNSFSSACRCANDFKDIKSREDLAPYDFVAHVKILSKKAPPETTANKHSPIGQLTFKILELYKGSNITQLQEYSVGTSCDLGIGIEQEWVVFAKTVDGKLSLTSCDRNVMYKDTDGTRDWHYESGFTEISQLKKVYRLTEEKPKDGLHKMYYPNGSPELEETYLHGERQGERKIWHKNGVLWGQQFFTNDSLNGKSVWHYPSGQLHTESYFLNGIPSNISRVYYDSTINESWKKLLIRDFYKTEDSLNFEYKRIQVHHESVYNFKGEAILSKEYSRLGKLTHEYVKDTERDFSTSIYYHDNGLISSITHYRALMNFGRTEEFDNNGKLKKFWEYDDNGKLLKRWISQ